MVRKDAIPLIETAITTGVWRTYMNPLLWEYPVNFPDTLLEKFKAAIPDFMDRMQALAEVTKRNVDKCHVELIDVPVLADSLMGQLEIIIKKPVVVALFVVFYKGEFWVQEKEFLPFEING